MLQGNFDPNRRFSCTSAVIVAVVGRAEKRIADRGTGRQTGDNDMNKRARNSFQTLNITSIKMHPLSR